LQPMYLQGVIFHIKYTWIMGQVYFRKNRFINCGPHLLNGSALVRELILYNGYKRSRRYLAGSKMIFHYVSI